MGPLVNGRGQKGGSSLKQGGHGSELEGEVRGANGEGAAGRARWGKILCSNVPAKETTCKFLKGKLNSLNKTLR